MALIELSEVTRQVSLPTGDALHILKGVDLRVEAGEHISIVGRSGTGKSTLLNIIGLLDQPSSGGYVVDGKDALRLGEGRRSRMRGDTFGFVFQQFNIFNARTAQENVEVPLLYTTGSQFWRRHELAAQMLGRVGLGDRLDSYPTEMSGGEQQRIAIARALVRNPRIILADEPTGALDPDTGRSVMGLLEEVAAENNAALVVITHDLNVAIRADQVLSLYDGVLHTVDNAREVLVPTEMGGLGVTGGGVPLTADGPATEWISGEPTADDLDTGTQPTLGGPYTATPLPTATPPPTSAPIRTGQTQQTGGDPRTGEDGAVVEDEYAGEPEFEEDPPARALIKRWKRRGRNENV